MDYVITGIGLYNGLGKNARASFEALLKGESAIVPKVWPEEGSASFPQTYNSIPKTNAALCPAPSDDENIEKFSKYWRHWDPVTKIGMLATEEAIRDSGFSSKAAGVSFSSFIGGSQTRLDVVNAINTGKRYNPRKSLNMGIDHTAAQVAAIYGFTGPNYSLNSTCTTGIISIDNAISYLKANPDMDGMLVGATECSTDVVFMFWFSILGALSPTGTSAPFDQSRNGLVLGEGAASIVIEPMDKALNRGAKIYAIIKGSGIVTIFDSDTSPDPDGLGAKGAMEAACTNSGIDISHIDYINAHATSTPVGDIIEFNAINKLFDRDINVVSNKGQIGHTMSACGLMETVYTLLTMETGMSPGNANLVTPIGESKVILPTRAVEVDIKYAMKNSFGFGGRNASMILEKV